jgi:arylsulfatase A-like enzyme
MITRMDRDIGTLLKRLQEAGLDNQTIVFFSSDNGPQREGGNDPKFFTSAGPLRGIKRDLHEGGIRVPLIARWPGKIKAGITNDHVCAFWDFLPTAAQLAGGKEPRGLDGLSLVPSLFGEKQANHEFLYWEFHERGSQQAVRSGDWKAVRRNPAAPLELYDLKNDIGEAKDVAAEHTDVSARMQGYLKKAHTESLQWPIRTGS